MKVSKLILSTFIIFLSISAFSQFSKGMLKMEVSSIRMNGEDAPPEMASALGNMDIKIYSDGIIQKSVVSMMMMKTITLMDSRLDTIHIFMDMMGKKYKISESRQANHDTVHNALKALQDKMEIKEYPTDIKEILGYKCHRVELKMKIPNPKSKNNEMQEVNIKMYVTKELKFDASFVTQTSKKLALNGTPLEYNMVMGNGSFQMEILMMAKEYKKEIDASDLMPPTGNYTKYTMEQFQKEMGGMGR